MNVLIFLPLSTTEIPANASAFRDAAALALCNGLATLLALVLVQNCIFIDVYKANTSMSKLAPALA